MSFDDNLEPLAHAGEQRRQLHTIITEVIDVASSLESAAGTELEQIGSRVDSDAFRVMIVGEFKRGKSTLVNALLGADVLPAYAKPCTAVVTEVRWMTEPGVELWPADGSDPVKAPIDDLSSIITIADGAHQASAETSPWKLAVVGWPLPLCENGVILIDSPGLNEHPSRQVVTLDYLRHADAIVFVQDCQAAVSMEEVKFMKRYLEAYDLFFVFNKINLIDPDEVDGVKTDILHRIGANRGEQRRDRYFFIDARAAVKARTIGDEAKWLQSSVGLFRGALQTYLVNERHKAKVVVPARDIRRIIRQLRQRLPEQRAMLEADESGLRRRYEQAQAPLADLESRETHIGEVLGLRMDELRGDVEDQMRERLLDISKEISGIIMAATPASRLKLIPWKVKEAAEAFATELGGIASNEVSNRLAAWGKQTLRPHVEDALRVMAGELDKEIGTFFGDLGEVRAGLTGSSGQDGNESEHMIERVINSMDIRFDEGIENVDAREGVNHLLQQVVAGVGVTLVWLFTPFGFISIIGGAIMADRIIDKRKEKVDQRIRDEIAKDLAEQLRSEADVNAERVAADFIKELAPIADAVRAGVQDQVAELRSQVESALATTTRGTDQVEARRKELDRIGSSLEAASHDLEDLIADVVL